MAIKRSANGKIIAKKFSFEQLKEAAAHNGHGFCRACGSEAFGVEPDARKYKCESCELYHVYGAEELMMMQLF